MRGMRRILVWAVAGAIVVGGVGARAVGEQDGGVRVGEFVALRLGNGDLVRGEVIGVGEEGIRIRHEVFGELVVPGDAVVESRRAIEGGTTADEAGNPADETPSQSAPPPTDAAPTDAAPTAPPPTTPPPAVPEATPPPPPPPPAEEKPKWDANLTLGLSGSTGTTDRTNLRMNFAGDFKKKGQRLNVRTTYLLNWQDERRTQNRLDVSGRSEWFKEDGTYRVFLESAVNFDEFRDYDARVNAGGGVGFKPIKNEDTDLLLRVGLGGSREIGSPDNTIRPEAILGLELTQKLFEKQRLVGSVEAFPDLEEEGKYRLTARGTWEVKLDAKNNISLQVGFEHRIDTHQARGRQSDTDYFASVVLRF